MLKHGGIASADDLSFIEADLTSDTNWSKALQGCKYVLHVASPTQINEVDEKAMIQAAVNGVLHVLKAAKNTWILDSKICHTFHCHLKNNSVSAQPNCWERKINKMALQKKS